MTDLSPFTVEHIAAGVVRERSADGAFYIFSVDNGHPMTIHSWLNNVREILSDWPSGRVCLLMHDLHKTGRLNLDESAIHLLDQLFVLRPDVERYVAFILPNTDTVYMNLFVNVLKLKVRSNYCIHWELFRSRRDAYSWLLKVRNERQCAN